MTWPQSRHALQLLAEKRIGRPMREARAREDAQMAASAKALRSTPESSR